MPNTIKKVAVIGAGTMGAGIAGLCAANGCDVVLLDIKTETSEQGIEKLCGGRNPTITAEQAAKITAASLDDLNLISDCDWICEAVVENLQIKRDLFAKLESVRKDGSIVSTNTSGIPLRDIYADMPERLQQDIAVTHFFNPVHIMKLVELVPGTSTTESNMQTLADFLGGSEGEGLAKGVVYAKDTVNFIGNRIGCFWMLAGLNKALESSPFTYASALVPEISDDIVNIDRAMKWGFNWAHGPFELMDLVGPARIAEKLQSEGAEVTGMLKVLVDNGLEKFYQTETDYLGVDGRYHSGA